MDTGNGYVDEDELVGYMKKLGRYKLRTSKCDRLGMIDEAQLTALGKLLWSGGGGGWHCDATLTHPNITPV